MTTQTEGAVVEHTAAGLPATLQEQLRKEAEQMTKKLAAPAGDLIRLLKTKKFKLPDGREAPGPLRVVVLDFVSYNAYYDRPWSEDNPTPPACFAIDNDPKKLAPHATSPDRQADVCNECPWDVFGTKGKGKACGNHRLLAVVEPTADPESNMYLIRTSPSSIKHFDSYVNAVLSKYPMGLISVTTEIWFDPDVDYASLRFGSPEVNENLAVHATRRAAALKRLMTPPDVSGYEPPKKAAPAQKSRGK